MKKVLLIVYMVLGTLCVLADNVTISTATLNPGASSEYVAVTVGLNGTRNYTSYNMDITLPEGWSMEYRNNEPRIVMVKNEGIYPYTDDYDDEDNPIKVYSHTVSGTFGVVGERTLRVACMSNKNHVFTATSGPLFRIYLKASPYAKPGTPDIQITGTDFATYSAGVTTPYHFDDAVSNAVTVSTTATAPLVISSSLWSTCVLPFDADIPNGVTAYTGNHVENGAIYLDEATSFSAYTPYILHSSSVVNTTVSGTVDPLAYPEDGYVSDAASVLHGAIVPQTITNGYVLQKDPNESEVKFYDVNGAAFVIPAGKCWLTLPSSNNSPDLRLVIEQEASLENQMEFLDGQIYTVLGMPVGNPSPGHIYIQNGKVFLQTK